MKNTQGDHFRLINPTHLGKILPSGKENIPFEEGELHTIKNFLNNGFTLIGFKPKSVLKKYHNKTTSIFLVPDDDAIQNSSCALDALILRMIQKDQIAIARIKKENFMAKFVALLPRHEKHGAVASGFNMIVLPFSDDLRDLTEE